MPKLPVDDQNRLNELRVKVYSYAAKRLLNNVKDPLIIFDKNIEEHKGRIGKALRLLIDSNTIVYNGRLSSKNKYGNVKDLPTYRITRFDTDSAQYAEVPVFMTTWQEYHDEIFSDGYDAPKDQEEFDRVGYQDLYKMEKAHAIHVYWHQDDYTTTTNDKNLYVYPKALVETRIKAILRAIVERHFQDDFNSKIERYLNLPADSLKRKDTYNVSVRNFCARNADLTDERYFGDNGFLAEYEHYRKYYEALSYNLRKFDVLIQSRGGHAAVVRDMRKDSITLLLEDSPLLMGYEPTKDELRDPEKDDVKKRWTTKLYNTFILRHADYFDYDTLYSTDVSVSYFEGGKALLRYNRVVTRHTYNPNPEENEIIAAYEKESAQCTTNKI